MAIALVAIARNEGDCIGRMLESVIGVVDEMVVVDTGSSDETVDIARRMGAKVISYSWDNHFANARNFSMSKTRCPWRLVLDADEQLTNGAAVLRNVGHQRPTYVGRVEILSTFTDPLYPNETLTSSDFVSRLLPAGTEYVGKIHEQPVHSFLTVNLPVTVQHDGYEPKKLEKKRERNLRLLKEALAQDAENPYLNFQYARELKTGARITDASVVLQSVIAAKSLRSAPWWEDAICLALEVFVASADFTAGLALIEEEAEALTNSVDFWFTVGIFSFRIAEHHPTAARDALERMENAFQYCLELGRRGFKSRMVLGRESHLSIQNLAALTRSRSA